jgi:branched-chain amino acid transport system permease protein
MDSLIQIIFRSIEMGGIYSLAAFGITLIFRSSNMTNFAQGSMAMFNAYISYILMKSLGFSTPLAALFGVIISLVIGGFNYLTIIKKAENASSVAKQIITMGLIILLTGLAPIIFGTDPVYFPTILPNKTFTVLGSAITYNGLFNIGVSVILVTVLFLLLKYTRFGLGIRMTASDKETAMLMGVRTDMVTLFAWAIAGAFGLISAIMIAPMSGVQPNMMNTIQIAALISCVLGGLNKFWGPIVAAYIFAIGRNVLLLYVSSTWGEQILYVLIILIINLRPQGLFGRKEIKKV